jgi:hypothetical protein
LCVRHVTQRHEVAIGGYPQPYPWGSLGLDLGGILWNSLTDIQGQSSLLINISSMLTMDCHLFLPATMSSSTVLDKTVSYTTRMMQWYRWKLAAKQISSGHLPLYVTKDGVLLGVLLGVARRMPTILAQQIRPIG